MNTGAYACALTVARGALRRGYCLNGFALVSLCGVNHDYRAGGRSLLFLRRREDVRRVQLELQILPLTQITDQIERLLIHHFDVTIVSRTADWPSTFTCIVAPSFTVQ